MDAQEHREGTFTWSCCCHLHMQPALLLCRHQEMFRYDLILHFVSLLFFLKYCNKTSKHPTYFQVCIYSLTFFQFLYPLSADVLSPGENVQWPLIIHDLWHKDRRKSMWLKMKFNSFKGKKPNAFDHVHCSSSLSPRQGGWPTVCLKGPLWCDLTPNTCSVTESTHFICVWDMVSLQSTSTFSSSGESDSCVLVVQIWL